MNLFIEGNQRPLMVTDKVIRSSGELEVTKSVECDTFSLQCSDAVCWVTGRTSGL